jgi:hypothetical protein
MHRRDDHSLTKHTLNLYTGDYARLQGLTPARIGAAKVIRDLIRSHIRKIEEEAAQRYPSYGHSTDGLLYE